LDGAIRQFGHGFPNTGLLMKYKKKRETAQDARLRSDDPVPNGGFQGIL
jgi:hypothetical protein